MVKVDMGCDRSMTVRDSMRRWVTRGAPWIVTALFLAPSVLLSLPAPTLASASGPPVSATTPALMVSPAPTDARVTVAPSFHPPAGTHPLGPANPEVPMSVAVGLSVPDPEGLSAYLAAEYTPGTPLYHAFLSPATLAARYGPTAETVQWATSYFAGFGLAVTPEPNGLILLVQGTPSEVGAAFQTSFEEYQDPSGRLFLSHATPATLPAGIPWAGALGLGNVTPIVPAADPAGTEVAVAGPAVGCTVGPTGLSPCEIQTAYALSPLLASGTNGTGETVGIVDAYSGVEPESQLVADFHSFTTEFGLPVGSVHYLYPVPTSQNLNLTTVNPNWGLEEAVDLEWARAAAPGANLDMTFSPNSGAGLYAAIDALVASSAVNTLSLSWGEPDVGVYNSFSTPCTSSCNASTDGSYALLSPVLEFAAAEGISVFSASGDCGASDGTGGLSTNFPASDPYVTGVGGTVLTIYANGTYDTETGWSGNETGSVAPGCTNQGGSGGGFAPFPRPWWQVNRGLPSTPARRGVPDVALDGYTPISTAYGGSYVAVIGTSIGTPIWAGLAAIADQHAGTALGFLDPALYRIANGARYLTDFHEVLSGNNGYPAGPNWNPVTGLGTPIAASLVPDLSVVPTTTSGGPSAFLYASPRFGPAPLNVTFGLVVSGGTGTYPLEGAYFGDGNASDGPGPFTHWFSLPGVYSAVGYAFDSHGNLSVSPPIAIVVGGGTALSVGLMVSNPRPATASPVTFTATASGGVPPYTYSFAFGDGTTLPNASSNVVAHAYGASGGFCAEVVVSDAATPVDGGASPRVAVSVGGASPPDCGNDSVPLTVTPAASGEVRDAPADFPSLFQVSGGSTAPSGVGPSVQYVTNDSYVAACECTILRHPGTYEIRAYANDSENEQATAETNVTVTPPLLGTFAVSRPWGAAPLPVEFSATVQGGYEASASQTHWTFGDGNNAVGASVLETYETPGEYLAVGQVSDAGDGNASEAFLIDVLPPGPLQAVGIVGSIDPAVNVSSGSTVAFTASIVAPSGGMPLTVGWTLGEGQSAFGPGANQSYFGPFPSPAPNTLLGSVSALLPNTVPVDTLPFTLPSFFALEANGFVPKVSALALSSTVSPLRGLTPFTVKAGASVSGPGGGTAAWLWGDGESNDSAPASHTYTTAGEYTVEAQGRDAFGDQAVDSFQMVANGALQILGGPSPSSGAPPVTVTFTALGVGGSGPPYRYRWTFENGTNTTGPSVNVTYRSSGTYSVRVNVSDSSGDHAVRTFTVDVHPPSVLTAADILAAAGAVGAFVAVVRWAAGRRGRPGRPTPSPRPAAEDARRAG
jgi:hypothetical protein